MGKWKCDGNVNIVSLLKILEQFERGTMLLAFSALSLTGDKKRGQRLANGLNWMKLVKNKSKGNQRIPKTIFSYIFCRGKVQGNKAKQILEKIPTKCPKRKMNLRTTFYANLRKEKCVNKIPPSIKLRKKFIDFSTATQFSNGCKNKSKYC